MVLLTKLGGADRQLPMLRIGIVVQDLLMLIVPAAVVAMMSSNNAGEMLCLRQRPRFYPIFLTLLLMVVSASAMQWVVNLNESISFPQAWHGFEQTLRNMENAAGDSVKFILGPHTPMNLVVSILIVGILAGFSEELFFRGTLQRLFARTRLGHHGAIWITAMIFSAVHFQFFGFLPRMLLGAMFGYLLLWSGSIWLPMIGHAFNNTLYVVLIYVNGRGELADSHVTWGAVACSAVLSAICILSLKEMGVLKNQKSENS